MSEVLPDYREGFSFYEEWLAMQRVKDNSIEYKTPKTLIPTREVIVTAKI